MKYRDINWSVEINGETASCDDDALDFIAEQLQNGYTFGTFTIDNTDYDKFDKLKSELTDELGRDIDCDYDNSGELEELLKIAKKNKDYYVIELIEELLKEYE